MAPADAGFQKGLGGRHKIAFGFSAALPHPRPHSRFTGEGSWLLDGHSRQARRPKGLERLVGQDELLVPQAFGG